MIHTFKDAGYQVKSAFEDGVMELVFRIDPTDTAIGVMEQREHRAEYASIERFFSPKSVAIIGASRRRTRSVARSCATSCSATSPVASTW